MGKLTRRTGSNSKRSVGSLQQFCFLFVSFTAVSPASTIRIAREAKQCRLVRPPASLAEMFHADTVRITTPSALSREALRAFAKTYKRGPGAVQPCLSALRH